MIELKPTRHRFLMLAGVSLGLAGLIFAALAIVNWKSLDIEQRFFVVATGASGAVIGTMLLLLGRQGGLTFKAVKRLFIFLIGSTVILVGVALLVLPGPGWVTIFAGLAILATEFAFARRILHKARNSANFAAQSVGISGRWRKRLKLHSPPEDQPAHGANR